MGFEPFQVSLEDNAVNVDPINRAELLKAHMQRAALQNQRPAVITIATQAQAVMQQNQVQHQVVSVKARVDAPLTAGGCPPSHSEPPMRSLTPGQEGKTYQEPQQPRNPRSRPVLQTQPPSNRQLAMQPETQLRIQTQVPPHQSHQSPQYQQSPNPNPYTSFQQHNSPVYAQHSPNQNHPQQFPHPRQQVDNYHPQQVTRAQQQEVRISKHSQPHSQSQSQQSHPQYYQDVHLRQQQQQRIAQQTLPSQHPQPPQPRHPSQSLPQSQYQQQQTRVLVQQQSHPSHVSQHPQPHTRSYGDIQHPQQPTVHHPQHPQQAHVSQLPPPEPYSQSPSRVVTQQPPHPQQHQRRHYVQQLPPQPQQLQQPHPQSPASVYHDQVRFPTTSIPNGADYIMSIILDERHRANEAVVKLENEVKKLQGQVRLYNQLWQWLQVNAMRLQAERAKAASAEVGAGSSASANEISGEEGGSGEGVRDLAPIKQTEVRVKTEVDDDVPTGDGSRGGHAGMDTTSSNDEQHGERHQQVEPTSPLPLVLPPPTPTNAHTMPPFAKLFDLSKLNSTDLIAFLGALNGQPPVPEAPALAFTSGHVPGVQAQGQSRPPVQPHPEQISQPQPQLQMRPQPQPEPLTQTFRRPSSPQPHSASEDAEMLSARSSAIAQPHAPFVAPRSPRSSPVPTQYAPPLAPAPRQAQAAQPPILSPNSIQAGDASQPPRAVPPHHDGVGGQREQISRSGVGIPQGSQMSCLTSPPRQAQIQALPTPGPSPSSAQQQSRSFARQPFPPSRASPPNGDRVKVKQEEVEPAQPSAPTLVFGPVNPTSQQATLASGPPPAPPPRVSPPEVVQIDVYRRVHPGVGSGPSPARAGLVNIVTQTQTLVSSSSQPLPSPHMLPPNAGETGVQTGNPVEMNGQTRPAELQRQVQAQPPQPQIPVVERPDLATRQQTPNGPPLPVSPPVRLPQPAPLPHVSPLNVRGDTVQVGQPGHSVVGNRPPQPTPPPRQVHDRPPPPQISVPRPAILATQQQSPVNSPSQPVQTPLLPNPAHEGQAGRITVGSGPPQPAAPTRQTQPPARVAVAEPAPLGDQKRAQAGDPPQPVLPPPGATSPNVAGFSVPNRQAGQLAMGGGLPPQTEPPRRLVQVQPLPQSPVAPPSNAVTQQQKQVDSPSQPVPPPRGSPPRPGGAAVQGRPRVGSLQGSSPTQSRKPAKPSPTRRQTQPAPNLSFYQAKPPMIRTVQVRQVPDSRSRDKPQPQSATAIRPPVTAFDPTPANAGGVGGTSTRPTPTRSATHPKRLPTEGWSSGAGGTKRPSLDAADSSRRDKKAKIS